MPKTLLAVDDSATMRKVLEITFSGEDFDVVTADSAKAALDKLNGDTSVVVIDTGLGGEEDGYELAKKVRAKENKAVIVLLASRYAPYDQAKGKEVGADDFADKSFDTQQLIDKVKRAIVARESGVGPQATAAAPAPAAAAPAAVPTAAPTPKPAPAAASAPGAPRPVGAVPPAAPAAPKPKMGGGTLIFGQDANANKPVAAPGASPAPPAVAAAAATGHAAGAGAAGAAVNGHLQGKLGELGLNAQQIEAVLALSREVVEKVVWEVVPQLAEALIKEEIARLTKEG